MNSLDVVSRNIWLDKFSLLKIHESPPPLPLFSFTNRATAEQEIWAVKNCWSNYHLCRCCFIVLSVARYFWWHFSSSVLDLLIIHIIFIFGNKQLMFFFLLLQPEGAAVGNYVIQYALALVCVMFLFAIIWFLYELCFWICKYFFFSFPHIMEG